MTKSHEQMPRGWPVFIATFCFTACLQAETTETQASDVEREIEEVVVTAKAGAAYASTSVTEGMRRSETPLTSSLALADNVPGVSIHEGDTFGFDDWSTTMSLRGFQMNLDEQHVGITIDGMPNGNSNYGGGSKANRYTDILNLQGVTVSQGTADIASRSNEALGGTLDFITDDPRPERRVGISLARAEFGGHKSYIRFDTGEMLPNTQAWISATTQSATDWLEGSAENWRDHVALKLTATRGRADVTAYASWDDIHEDNYQRLYSSSEFESDPNWDRLTGEWTGIPHIDQAYRRVWSQMRDNRFIYVKVDTLWQDVRLIASVYGHKNSGRGDWAPPYLVDVVDDSGGPESERVGTRTHFGGEIFDLIYFVDAAGYRLQPRVGCESTIDFPYGGASPEADPACYGANAIAVQTYRHSHYAKKRAGASVDLEWDTSWSNGNENLVRAGFWHEGLRRDEMRDWHDIADTSKGPEFEPIAYWVQYDRQYPAKTSKLYVENTFTTPNLKVTTGVKWHRGVVERKDLLGELEDMSVESSSPILLSTGATLQLPLDGLETYFGYARNYKALSDLLFERTASRLDRIEPETARNVELGLRYSWGSSSLAATWYDIGFSNRIVFVNELDFGMPDFLSGTDGTFINAGGVDSRGLEIAGFLRFSHNLSLYLAYTSDSSHYVGTGTAGIDESIGIVVGNDVAGVPTNMLVSSVEWYGERFLAGMTHKITGDRYVDLANTWKASSYGTTDAHIGAEWVVRGGAATINVRLTANNLFDTDHLAGISGEGAWIGAPRTISMLFEIGFP